MDKVKVLQCKLIDYAIEHHEELNIKEMYDIVDMIKDLSETLYYYDAAIAMEKGGSQVTKIVTKE